MTLKVSDRGRLWRWIALLCALALLNASLTFRNVWPTPGIEWTGDLSIELAVFVLGLVLASRRFGAPPRSLITWLAGLWLLLTIGRYADVTAPAVYGREINLYWDVRHMGAVAADAGDGGVALDRGWRASPASCSSRTWRTGSCDGRSAASPTR